MYEDSGWCPRCRATEAETAVKDAVSDALAPYGVPWTEVLDSFDTSSGRGFLMHCWADVQRRVKQDGGTLCHDCTDIAISGDAEDRGDDERLEAS